MAEKWYIKQHDLEPGLEIQLLDGTDPVDLLNATAVAFFMSSRRTGLKASGPMLIADQTAPDTLGVVTYVWQPGDTGVAGEYTAEIQVTWPASRTQTFPANSYFTISIQKDLAD